MTLSFYPLYGPFNAVYTPYVYKTLSNNNIMYILSDKKNKFILTAYKGPSRCFYLYGCITIKKF